MVAKRRKAEGVSVADAIRKGLGDERYAVERKLQAKYRSLPDGFIAWCEDETCVLDKATNTWTPFRFEDWQEMELRSVLFTDEQGNLKYSTIVLSWPRRHGKSEIAARIDIWRCLNWDNQVAVVMSNSQEQSTDTVWKIADDMIRNSPKLKFRLDTGEIVITTTEITFTKTSSVIRFSPASEKSAYGKKINVAHVLELCKATDSELYDTLHSSTGDAFMGLTIADSNVGTIDNIVVKLINLGQSGEDPQIGVSYIHYKDFADAIARGPRWIDAKWLRSCAAQMMPGEFRRNHLNIPATVGSKLFTEAQVNACFDRVPKGWFIPSGCEGGDGAREGEIVTLPKIFSREDFQRLRNRCALYGVLSKAGGLDRALPFAKRDRTFWAVIAKLLVETDEQEVPIFDEDGNITGYEAPDPYVYVLLNLVEFPWSNAAAIQRVIEADVERYDGIDQMGFEQYQAADLKDWAEGRGWAAVLTHFTGPVQLEVYSDFYRIVASGRFFASPEHWILRAEMQNVEEDESAKTPSFGGPKVTVTDPDGKKVRIKDDSVDAVLNGIIAARGEMSVPQGPPATRPGGSIYDRAG